MDLGLKCLNNTFLSYEIVRPYGTYQPLNKSDTIYVYRNHVNGLGSK